MPKPKTDREIYLDYCNQARRNLRDQLRRYIRTLRISEFELGETPAERAECEAIASKLEEAISLINDPDDIDPEILDAQNNHGQD